MRYLQGREHPSGVFLQILLPMKPHTRTAQTAEMFRPRLDELLNMKHPLIRLAGLIDRGLIEQHFAGHFCSSRGRPALPPRLVAGLMYLQHAHDASDEMVVNTWLENPYWQFFTGETYLQIELPNRATSGSFQPHALAPAHWRRGRGVAVGRDHRGRESCRPDLSPPSGT